MKKLKHREFVTKLKIKNNSSTWKYIEEGKTQASDFKKNIQNIINIKIYDCFKTKIISYIYRITFTVTTSTYQNTRNTRILGREEIDKRKPFLMEEIKAKNIFNWKGRFLNWFKIAKEFLQTK